MKWVDNDRDAFDESVDLDDQAGELNDTAADSFADVDFNAIDGNGLKLTVVNTGEEIVVPDQAEVIIGREDPISGIFPDIDTTRYGGEENGVSRQHAKITHVGTDYKVEDLNSVNMTFLNRTKLAPNSPVVIADGDQLMLGRLKLNVVLS